MKIFTSQSQKIGKIGEDIAIKFLMKHDFSILETNYTKKWGEIDIIAQKNHKFFFIEVKSVSRSLVSTVSENIEGDDNVIRETENDYQPEDNMHPWKRKRLARTVETYLISQRVGNVEWQFDVLLVYLDLKTKRARVKVIENVIL
ncbi:YraN family protein [Candidatus Nomurabacteria bacterium]|nr:YraN family protein [Candidatus Nomurabacteria bacterium]